MLAKRAQSINEYVMVIAVVTLAAVTMQTHIKRGIQGVIKLTADDLVTGWQLQAVPPSPEVPADGLIPESKLHKTAKEYKDINGGFVEGVRSGNKISYYHFTSSPDDKTMIGKEDTITHDYTEFGSDGFAIGVANKVNINYDLKFKRNEDATTYETTSVTVYEKIGVDKDGKAIYSDIGTTYGKYEMVKLSSGAAGEAIVQQKGIEELGLYAYTAPAGPLVVTNNPSVHPGVQPKTVTVTEFALSSVTIPWTSYHPFITGNFGLSDVKAEIKGNNVNYYLRATDSLIGIEDARTNDFTLFDEDGFVDIVLDKNGTNYGLKRSDNKEAGKIISVTLKKDGKVIGTYTKYQPVSIGAASTTGPFLGIKARETVSSETTNVNGKWEATYKLGAETFGSLEKKKLGDTATLTSGTDKKTDGI